jgi:ribosomal protein L37AE/L43A
MPKVKCAICSKEQELRYLRRCSKCEIWICSNCVSKPGLFINAYHCPACGKELKYNVG